MWREQKGALGVAASCRQSSGMRKEGGVLSGGMLRQSQTATNPGISVAFPGHTANNQYFPGGNTLTGHAIRLSMYSRRETSGFHFLPRKNFRSSKQLSAALVYLRQTSASPSSTLH